MEQAGGGIQHIILVVSGIDGGINLLKERQPFFYPGVCFGSNVTWTVESATEERRLFPVEVYPVDGPGIGGITAISMCHVFGENKELVGIDFVPPVGQFKPALSFYTVDKDKLINLFGGTFAIMKIGMRIIAYISDI